MLIFAVDDERAMLEQLCDAVREAAPNAEVIGFHRASELLNAITERGRRPDVVFSDIELPGMNGLSLATRIKKEAPEAKIVFVTGYSEYAVEAYRRHINGYVMKPVDAAMIRDELMALPIEIKAEPDKLFVQCFGVFEVYWNGKPLPFTRRKTKELFAYLINRRGASCTAEELADALWEGEADMKKIKHQIRNLVSDLKDTLKSIGMEELLIRKSGILAIKAEKIDCDYYRLLRGDSDAVNSYYGEYMTQFSWAEMSAGKLWFDNYTN